MNDLNPAVHVAMASDDRYAHHLAVAVCSILKNLSPNKNLCVHLLYERLEERTKQKLELLKNLRQFELHYINVSCEKFAPFKVMVGLYISRLTYARFQLPVILKALDKCLYLDCDTLVRQDLGELWDIELPEQKILGAIEEPGARIKRNEELGISERYSYFNAGVLMLDLARLREIGLEEKAFSYLQEHGSLLYADQDVLNALFYNAWHPLPLKWNVHSNVFMLKSVNRYCCYQEKEVDEACENAALVHFSHERKPDSFVSQSPYRDEYWKYLKCTAWKYILPKDISGKNVILRMYWAIKSATRRIPLIFYAMRMVKRMCTGYYRVHSKKLSG